MEIKKVGVVGCGTMGGGITQVCALSGYQVVTSEINDELLKKGLNSISTQLARSVEKGKLSQADKDATMARIKGTITTKDFGDCDLVIEAAVELMDLKKKIFADLDKVTPRHAILASNTSSLSVMDMATQTTRPEKVLGIHFFNPVPVMRLVELIRTIATSDETFETGRRFAHAMGKTVVAAKDAPGFIVNRLMVPQILHAVRLLESGIASREDIDTAIQLGLNHPMGPLTLIDLVGLDVVYFIAQAVYEETKDPQYIIPNLMHKMFAARWLGRKTGKGFYDYK